jgi:hypothetical protein
MIGMDDKTILGNINELVEEEKKLRAANHGLAGEDRLRLQHIEQQLDQCWDLLRQRRAQEEFGADPDTAHERSVNEVEGYLQ